MKNLIMAVLLIAASTANAQIGLQQDENKIKFLYSIKGYHPGSRFYAPKGLALDEDRNLIYISDTDADAVYAFSTQGIAKFTIGLNKELKSPEALAVDRRGNLYVAEQGKSKIKVFNTKNEMTEVIDVGGIVEGAGPAARIRVGRDGALYVVDQLNQQVIVLDEKRQLRVKFGKPGADRGQFKTIEDIAVDRQGRIYVTDSSGIPVQVFDKKGKFIYRFGQRGALQEDFVQPTAITVDRFDQVWVVDTSEHTVKIFDRVGFYLRSFGEYGMTEGLLYYPIALAVDGFGKVYVLERGLRRMQVFALDKPFEPFRRR